MDGIERFLDRNVNKGTVVALDSSYGRFFTALADTTKPLNSVLVLTSRVLPSVFETFANNQQEDKAATAITIKQAQGFSLDQIKSMLPVRNKNDDEVAKCLGWFGEHRYGVTLAAESLKEHDFAELEYEMAEADPEVRVPKMIGLSLKDVREAEPPAGEYAYQLLERLAVFVEPVDTKVACIGLDPTDQPHFNETISLLKRKKLLFEVRLFNDRICYVVHPSAREYIFYHEHHSSPADLPSFALSGFTSAASTVYPGDRQSAGKKTVVGLLESLKKQRSRADRDKNEQVELCRAAFGVVRSRMVATTVSRWSRYDEYLRFLLR